MSERNVELYRRLLEAFNARNIEAIIAYVDPSIEFHSTFAAVGGAVYHGHDGMRSWHRELEDAWGAQIRLEAETYFDLGEHTLMFGNLHGRGQHSNVEVAMPVTQVARWRDYLVVYLKSYAHRQDALTELRVYDDDLEPIDP